eukprot:CAMPEP_0197628538 /NCGR_PEP_ID=MMETSP1338-20131121/6804_1 /TAXON_ID=43686 ORGANISM="Pelagodinium beii, Strain RCC1491" /NCGR_SAMPLE_ID=MMETSP1338 /ASSEMBLY_ACC=CAM_ASM_000754 /LENGTH=1214 /DNA_ID=CAMNT_0043199521 /DNA_START=16 /DNA_END=3656 /DNA_ORIENTATION=+
MLGLQNLASCQVGTRKLIFAVLLVLVLPSVSLQHEDESPPQWQSAFTLPHGKNVISQIPAVEVIPNPATIWGGLQKDPNSILHVAAAAVLIMISVCLPVIFSRKNLGDYADQENTKNYVQQNEAEDEKLGRTITASSSFMANVVASIEDAYTEEEEEGEEAGSPSSLVLGMSLHFRDFEFEQAWEAESYPKNIQRGSLLLAGLSIMLMIDRAAWIFEEQCRSTDVLQFAAGVATGDQLERHKFNVASLCILAPVTSACLANTKAQKAAMHWFLIAFLSVFVIVLSMPPFNPTCDELRAMVETFQHGNCPATSFDMMLRKLDCTLQGQTSCQMFQLFLLILPYALPQFRHSHLGLIWILTAYVGLSWFYEAMWEPDSLERVHHSDIALHSVFLVVTVCLTTSRKYTLEKGMRKQFVDDYRQKKSMEKLYYIFKDMVPEHVILPMLRKEVVSAAIPKVTVFFVLINDFDEFSSKLNPEELLKFLNKYFSQMDSICAANKVTKVETVAEEYVACVGVMPEERNVTENDHGKLLIRLFKAADEILNLQNDEDNVKFKMGAHTGPIVAGVIGKKLPRFRLFGDTINTTARLMQKGLPGELQFAEETRRELPASVPWKERGPVVMKGKGEVTTYLFDREATKAELKRSSSLKSKRPSISTMELLAAPKSVKFDEEVDVESSAETDAAEKLSEPQLDEVMREVVSEEDERKKYWLLSERRGFDEQMEDDWLRWSHHSGVVRKFLLRCHRQAHAFAWLSLVEFMHMTQMEAWANQDKPKGILPKREDGRFIAFFCSRFVCMLILVIWCGLAARTRWILDCPKSVQRWLLFSTCVTATCMWYSYDAVVLNHGKKGYRQMDQLDLINQQFTLIFAIVYFLVCNWHPVSFYNSIAFFLVACIFMNLRNCTSMYISNVGVVAFVSSAALSVILAHEDEQTSRARFKSKVRVHETETQISDVLDTLLPPLLVEELRTSSAGSADLPSHQFKLATITQSDLAGFTQLSATKQPHEIVVFMGDLFGAFDKLADVFKVYKVETIGDAYIAGMAEQPLTETNSPVAVVKFGLAMIQATKKWADNMKVEVICRVGVHHGECVGGIVGTGMMRYHLFGQFMGVVDTLEATSKLGVCQISGACKKAMETELVDKNRSLTDDPHLKLNPRDGEKLTTSKGEVHEYSEVGGPTFLLYPPEEDLEEAFSNRPQVEAAESPLREAAGPAPAAPEAAPA